MRGWRSIIWQSRMQAGGLTGQKAGRAESLRLSEQPFQPNGVCGKREKTDRAGMGMEKRRESGDSGKSPGRMRGRAAVVLLALALLTGCSRERMETRREIARIKEAAESMADRKSVV